MTVQGRGTTTGTQRVTVVFRIEVDVLTAEAESIRTGDDPETVDLVADRAMTEMGRLGLGHPDLTYEVEL